MLIHMVNVTLISTGHLYMASMVHLGPSPQSLETGEGLSQTWIASSCQAPKMGPSEWWVLPTSNQNSIDWLIIFNLVRNPQPGSWFMAGCLVHGWFRAIRSSKSANLKAAGAEDPHSFTTTSLGQQDLLCLAPGYLVPARSPINVVVEFVWGVKLSVVRLAFRLTGGPIHILNHSKTIEKMKSNGLRR